MDTEVRMCRYALERFVLGIMPKVYPDYYFSKNVKLVCQVWNALEMSVFY